MNRVNVDYTKIKKNSKTLKKVGDDIVVKKYEDAKEKFINEFESHPVTREISSGPNTTNSSNTLNGVGNLFSFIGFFDSDKPIDDLLNVLEKNFSIKKQNLKGDIKYTIDYPTLEKVKSSTPMPWENGNSWVVGIERGISGFSNYLYKKFVQGRSKEGVQSKNKVRLTAFKKTRYLSKIIDNFIDNVTK